MSRAKLKQEIIDIFLRNLEGNTLEAMADEVIDAIYKSIEWPTEQMNDVGGNLSDIGVPSMVWQAMLAASPLAPEGGKD